ncbi:hypothetical protein GGQ84_000412 [Desulfitispora alkaliphila]|uniref:hypothetical protein n=1 Tax=Desulfitispora alkaliphila TaxID=622674 RepID=UPI003D244013
MKIKNMLLLGLMILIALTSGCSRNAAPTVVYDYDIQEATVLIDEVEWLSAWLQTQDVILRSDAEKLIARFNEVLSYAGKNIITIAMTDGADWENSSLETLSLGNSYIHPTIYHEGVYVVSATEERTCETSEDTGECTTHFSTLVIRKEYSGSDDKLKDWYLEYIFTKRSHDGDWKFVSYNGIYNVEANLALKESFWEINY